MTTADERHVRDQVRGALETVTPSPVPAGAVIARGRAMRTRRRITIAVGVTAGLAVAAAAVGLGPGLLHQLLHPQLAQHRPGKPSVSVHRPGAGAPAGEIAWGRINGRHWQITITRSGIVSAAGSTDQGGGWKVYGSDPFNFAASGNGSAQAYFGAVRRDVTVITVRLGDGELLRLHPVTVFGQRLAGFETVASLPVARIAAYSGSRELAYAIPYNGNGLADWGQFLRPGQPVPRRMSRVLFAGYAAGQYHRVTVRIGPWGRCLFDHYGQGSNGTCGAALPGDSTSGGAIIQSERSGRPGLVAGALAGSAASLMLTTADGRSINVRLVPFAGLKYYTFILASHPRIVSWATFDAAGQLLKTGQGAP